MTNSKSISHDQIYPIGKNLPESSLKTVDLIKYGDGEFESIDVQKLIGFIRDCFSQYCENILPETILDRFPDYAIDIIFGERSEDWTKEKYAKIVEEEGIETFMTLKIATFFPSLATTIYDFQCETDQYLWDYGFSIIERDNEIELLSRYASERLKEELAGQI